ncbi:MAG TPA: ATP-binding protein [bacterium]|nr:ATP-binding protein [bacterium]
MDTVQKKKERSNLEGKAFLNLHKRVETAIMDYDMIHPGDHIMVGLSGGKDSSLLLALLARKKIETTNDFKLSAIFVRMGFTGDDEKLAYLKDYAMSLGVPFHAIEEPIFEAFKKEKKKPCYVCSRNRRIAMFRYAKEIGANVIAFGHHRDDFMQTLLLNILYGSCVETMKPNNPFFGGEFRVIRPMLYIDEKMITAEVKRRSIEVFPQGCPFSCMSERAYVKELITEAHKRHRRVRQSIFRSMFTVRPEYLLKPPSRKSML